MGKFWKLIGKGLGKGLVWVVGHPEALDIVLTLAGKKDAK